MQKNNYNYSKNTFYITVYNSYNIFDTSEIILFFIIYIIKKKNLNALKECYFDTHLQMGKMKMLVLYILNKTRRKFCL